MKLEEVCSILVKVEQEVDVNSIKYNDIYLWPLLRHCVWFILIDGAVSASDNKKQNAGFLSSVYNYTSLAFKKVIRLIKNYNNNYVYGDRATTVFFSRPVYLQKLNSGLLFDRIIDPLIFLCRNNERVSKFYLTSWSDTGSLYFQSNLLPQLEIYQDRKIESKTREKIYKLAIKIDIPPERLLQEFDKVWAVYLRWYLTGKKYFSNNPTVKKMFVTSWYFPDMMGLISAAKAHGVETIDVQHGKQGKYQGMYSWWKKIPDSGYQSLPDRFWCWGKPSAEHMMQSNHNYALHKPFVGGYPWLDFYRKYVSILQREKQQKEKNLIKVLVTLQPLQGEHKEPIPDFIISYMLSEKCNNVVFTFRCHPNFQNCIHYCESRLKNISSSKYKICDGKPNLYDELLKSTHHITAYSSCCYEASVLNVPTLLFGDDALLIYNVEINNEAFFWTNGEAKELDCWLRTLSAKQNINDNSYIESSMVTAKKAVLFPGSLQG